MMDGNTQTITLQVQQTLNDAIIANDNNEKNLCHLYANKENNILSVNDNKIWVK